MGIISHEFKDKFWKNLVGVKSLRLYDYLQLQSFKNLHGEILLARCARTILGGAALKSWVIFSDALSCNVQIVNKMGLNSNKTC